MKAPHASPRPARVSYQPLAWLAQFSEDPAEQQAADMALDELDRLRRAAHRATDVRVRRIRPSLGLLAARGNAGSLVEALDALAAPDENDESDQTMAELHALAIDVWEFLDKLVDTALTQEAH